MAVSDRLNPSCNWNLSFFIAAYGRPTFWGAVGCCQSVLNATAKSTCNSRKYDINSPLPRDLHWPRVPERIRFRVAVFNCVWQSPHDSTWIPGEIYSGSCWRRLSDTTAVSVVWLCVVPRRHCRLAHDINDLEDRAFGIVVPRADNISATSPDALKRRLNTRFHQYSLTYNVNSICQQYSCCPYLSLGLNYSYGRLNLPFS